MLMASVTIMIAKLAIVTEGAPPDPQPQERRLRDFNDDDKEKERDRGSRERLELSVSVRMIPVGRLVREPQADERDDVRRPVGKRMESVRENADGAAQRDR